MGLYSRFFSNSLRLCKHGAVLAFFIAVLLWGGLSSWGQTTHLQAILEAKVIRVGTTGDYPPFSWLNPKTNQYEGVDIIMARTMAKALGVEIEFVPTTWRNLIPDLEANRFDMAVGGITVTLDRQKHAFFSEPYMQDGKVPLTPCSQRNRFNTLADLDKATVRVVENPGGTNEAFARAHFHHARLSIAENNQTPFEHLLNGQADVMITDRAEAQWQTRVHRQLCVIHADQPLTRQAKAYLLPQGDVALQQWVNLWLKETLPEAKKAYQRYILPENKPNWD